MEEVETKSGCINCRDQCGKVVLYLSIALLIVLVTAGVIVLAILVADHRPNISGNKGDIGEVKKDIEDLLATLEGKISSEVNKAKKELTKSIEEQIEAAKAELIGDINTKVAKARDDLDNEVSKVDGRIDTTKSQLTGMVTLSVNTLNAEISKLKGKMDIIDVTGKINAVKNTLDKKIGDVETKVENVKTELANDLSAKATELRKEMNKSKSELLDKITETNNDLEKGVSDSKIDADGKIRAAEMGLDNQIFLLGNRLDEFNINTGYKYGNLSALVGNVQESYESKLNGLIDGGFSYGAVYCGNIEFDEVTNVQHQNLDSQNFTLKECISQCKSDSIYQFVNYKKEDRSCRCIAKKSGFVMKGSSKSGVDCYSFPYKYPSPQDLTV